jgi:hypothetical protein
MVVRLGPKSTLESGHVVQEGHPNSTELRLKRLHLHGAFAFPEPHKWRALEKHLRERQGIKVRAHCGLLPSGGGGRALRRGAWWGL